MKRYVEDVSLPLEACRQAAERGVLFEQKDTVAENAESIRSCESAEAAADDDNVVFFLEFVQRCNDAPILLLQTVQVCH